MRLRLSTFVLVFALAAPVTAHAQDPGFVGWSNALPPVPTDRAASLEGDLCPGGEEECVHGVIDEMYRRFDPLAEACHHDSMFALAYLRTTEEYHRFWHEDQFRDPAWLNHYDVVFGEYYFVAEDAYREGRRTDVPPAWLVAFDAARDRAVTGAGNFILGVNAHINRDLPFVLYRIGLLEPDGTTRKLDHDKVNEFLSRVAEDLYPEVEQRFDPTIRSGNVEQTTLDDWVSFQTIVAWREMAWRNAERLAAAPDEASRALVAQQIEDYAEALARQFRDRYSYRDGNSFTADDRDAYCAENWDNWPPA